MMAPIVAEAPTATGSMSRVWRDASSAALTSAISPGSGMPRLSRPMIPPTTRYTAIGGIVWRISSTFTQVTMPYAVDRLIDLSIRRCRRQPPRRVFHDPALPEAHRYGDEHICGKCDKIGRAHV